MLGRPREVSDFCSGRGLMFFKEKETQKLESRPLALPLTSFTVSAVTERPLAVFLVHENGGWKGSVR